MGNIVLFFFLRMCSWVWEYTLHTSNDAQSTHTACTSELPACSRPSVEMWGRYWRTKPGYVMYMYQRPVKNTHANLATVTISQADTRDWPRDASGQPMGYTRVSFQNRFTVPWCSRVKNNLSIIYKHMCSFLFRGVNMLIRIACNKQIDEMQRKYHLILDIF